MKTDYFQSTEFLEKEKAFLKKHDLVKINEEKRKILLTQVK